MLVAGSDVHVGAELMKEPNHVRVAREGGVVEGGQTAGRARVGIHTVLADQQLEHVDFFLPSEPDKGVLVDDEPPVGVTLSSKRRRSTQSKTIENPERKTRPAASPRRITLRSIPASLVYSSNIRFAC